MIRFILGMGGTIIVALTMAWGYQAAATGQPVAAPPPPPANEMFEYCYSTDDAFVICKLKEG